MANSRKTDSRDGPGSSWRKPRVQYGALPFRVGPNGRSEFMLVTSRETRRWIIPKGWPIKGLEPHAAAAREAYEEAGVTGDVGKRFVGKYRYEKRLKSGDTVTCEVRVFPFAVKQQRKRWPERRERQTGWFTAEDAASAVSDPELGDIISAFDPADPWRHEEQDKGREPAGAKRDGD